MSEQGSEQDAHVSNVNAMTSVRHIFSWTAVILLYLSSTTSIITLQGAESWGPTFHALPDSQVNGKGVNGGI